jgi:CBS-domain-containing membrane protein
MLREYAPLVSKLLQPGCGFSSPSQALPERVTADSPAIDVMTDLQRINAVVIRPDDTIEEANKRMIQRDVRLLLVLDHARKVEGLITATDTLGEKPMRVVAERRCRRQEVLVREIMTPQARLEVLDIEDVRRSKVWHIVSTLKQAGRQHAMVVEYDPSGRQTVRGLFSTSQIGRQLGAVIQTSEVARTFSEIEAALAH